MPTVNMSRGRPPGRSSARVLQRIGLGAALVGAVLIANLGAAEAASIRSVQMPGGPVGAPSQDERAAAFAAALRVFGAVPQADCRTNNPEQRPCIDTTPNSAVSPERGIAVFSVNDPGGMGGGLAIMGRTPTGEWDLWFGTQNVTYQRWELPGDMIVCADGDGARVRAPPGTDALVVATLPDLTPVPAEEFVLTRPGTVQPFTAGAGWYRISLPYAGWIHSTLLADARLGDCALRDAAVRSETPRTLDEAIRAYAQARFDRPSAGEVCSMVVEQAEPGAAQVVFGLTFSEGLAVVTFQRVNGHWLAVDEYPVQHGQG